MLVFDPDRAGEAGERRLLHLLEEPPSQAGCRMSSPPDIARSTSGHRSLGSTPNGKVKSDEKDSDELLQELLDSIAEDMAFVPGIGRSPRRG